MFHISSKYFNIFNNKPPASWVVHITGDFLTCYSCSYYSSMIQPSVLPSICSGVLLELGLWFFLNLGMVLETHMKFCMTELDFSGKLFLCQKLEKWTKKKPENKFLNLLKSLVFYFYWICSIIIIYIIFCVFAQIHDLEKCLFLRKQTLDVVSLVTGLWLYLKNELIKWTDCLHAGANSEKLKVISLFLGECDQKWAWLLNL